VEVRIQSRLTRGGPRAWEADKGHDDSDPRRSAKVASRLLSLACDLLSATLCRRSACDATTMISSRLERRGRRDFDGHVSRACGGRCKQVRSGCYVVGRRGPATHAPACSHNGGIRSQDSVGVRRQLAPDNRSSTCPRNPRATARHRGRTRVSRSSSFVCRRQKPADRPTHAPLGIAPKASRTALCRRAFSART
jgi:hypothetical protein